MNNQELIIDFLHSMWSNSANKEEFAKIIDARYSANGICSDMLEQFHIGRKGLINLNKAWNEIFANSKFKIINSEYINKNIVHVKWHVNTVNVGVFNNIKPTYEQYLFEGHAFYDIKGSYINEIKMASDIAYKIISSKKAIPIFKNTNTNTSYCDNKKLANKLSLLTTYLRSRLQSALTTKEIYVASLWLSNYTIKESAQILNLSTRSIEEYRNRVKFKLVASNKKELYDFLKTNMLLHSFSVIAEILNKYRYFSPNSFAS